MGDHLRWAQQIDEFDARGANHTSKGIQDMATHTRPFLITGAALASAAAIVAASPAFAPSNALPSPAALSSAKYELATFADVFTIPTSEWIASYFQGYGGVIGPTVTPNPTPPPATVSTPNPYAPQCNNDCTVAGVSGIAYLLADALINGNGKGWSDSGNWATSGVNYFYEAGLGYGIEYLAQTAVGSTNPLLQTAIALYFAGPVIGTQLYTTALTLSAALVNGVPLLGPYIAGGIYAYLGVGPTGQANGYTQGLSGVLNYITDLVTGSPTPYPGALQAASTPAASVLAAPAAAVQSAVSRASSLINVQVPSVASVAAPSSPAVASRAAVTASAAVAETKAESTSTDNSADDSTESTSTGTSTESTSTDTSTESTSTESTSTDTSTEPTKPAEPTKTKPAESPAKARKHPVRDAAAKVSKQINSALGGAAKAAAGSAG